MAKRNHGPNSSGGSSIKKRERVDIDFPVPVGPVPSEVGLLRAYLTKRQHLDRGEIKIAESMLLHGAKQHLSVKQLAWLTHHAKMVGAVYEEPDVLPVPVGCVSVQPWGALPKRPPRPSLQP